MDSIQPVGRIAKAAALHAALVLADARADDVALLGAEARATTEQIAGVKPCSTQTWALAAMMMRAHEAVAARVGPTVGPRR